MLLSLLGVLIPLSGFIISLGHMFALESKSSTYHQQRITSIWIVSLLYGKHMNNLLLVSKQPYGVGIHIILTLEIRKLSHREIK